MAKAIVFVAAVACFLLITEAHMTTVVINEEDENRSGHYGSCREKFQQQGQLDSCQRYIMQEAQRHRRGRSFDIMVDEEEENPSRMNPQLKQCCNQIGDLSFCRCDGLRMAVEKQMQRGHMGSEEMRTAYEIASNIPSMCKMPPGRCEFGGRHLF